MLKIDEALDVTFYKDVDSNKTFIKIVIPGNGLTSVAREATAEDFIQYDTHYINYINGTTFGTPLEKLEELSKESITKIKSCGFKNLEQLAAVSDYVLLNMGMKFGTSTFKARELAKQFLEKQSLLKLIKEDPKNFG